MGSDIFLTAIGVAALFFASLADIKTREVPDWVSYGLIAGGVLIQMLYSGIEGSWSVFLGSVLGLLLMVILGHVMFYARQWGGGDAKLLMGLGIIFWRRPFFVPAGEFNFLVTILLNIAVVGSAYGFVYGLILVIKNKKAFAKAFAEESSQQKVKRVKWCAIAVAGMAAITTMIIEDAGAKMILAVVALGILFYVYVRIGIKVVEKVCLTKKILVGKLRPGDWVEQDVKVRGKILYKKKPLGIEKEDIRILKKAGIKEVVVKEGIPFIPVYFLSVILSLITGKVAGLL